MSTTFVTEPDFIPPAARSGLLIRPASVPGQFVVKDRHFGTYFHIGEEEHFLLTQLDGRRDAVAICGAFGSQFGEPITPADLEDFVGLATRRRLLVPRGDGPSVPIEEREEEDLASEDADPEELRPQEIPAGSKRSKKQSLLHYRIPFFDPDACLNRLEPWMRWMWGAPFLLLSSGLIALAVTIMVTQHGQWLQAMPTALDWRTLALFALTVVGVSVAHEFAHGLTCKYYGGEVREMGFLLLYFMPCFYCNVSDAWLFRERWKRLSVGLAGGYCDLCLWAGATMVWRLTVPESPFHRVAWMVAIVAGGGCFFNFNPLVKLDGYYLLSDLTGIPNLCDRGRRRWLATLRWMLWGGPRPERVPHGRFLLLYGVSSWFFILSILSGLMFGMVHLSTSLLSIGHYGIALSSLMTAVIGKSVMKGVFAKDFKRMFTKRKGLVLIWVAFFIGVPTLFMVIPYQERAAGTFLMRPTTRVEINALEGGFLREIAVAEGTRVSEGTAVARIEIPDLETNLTRKAAEIRESEANLRRLEAGPRSEEILEQRDRVERGKAWAALGTVDLERAKQSFKEDMNRLERQLDQHRAELEFARKSLEQAEALFQQKGLSGQQLLNEKTNFEIKSQEFEEYSASKRSRIALGTTAAEAEAARREKELADEQSKLKLLESGGRPEEIEAENARLSRLREELNYLERLRSRVQLVSPVSGIVTTPRMHEKQGQFVPQGTVVCVVEELTDLRAEIAVPEDQVDAVRAGQRVELRIRSMPFRKFEAEVDSKAPSATMAPGQTQGTVTVYCRLTEPDAEILSGMTGHARIYRGTTPLGLSLLKGVFKQIRTEFWF